MNATHSGRLVVGAVGLVLLFGAAGCAGCGTPPADCTDVDKDQVTTCAGDCNDNDPAMNPNHAEVCDGKDNDCDGKVDDGVSCACTPGTTPLACGKNALCRRTCGTTGVYGACLPTGSSSVDTLTDLANCGECGNACPIPVNADATCRQGVCGRTPCKAGFFDLDGDSTNGCESTCTGPACLLPDGGQLALTSPPLPETGLVFQTPSSGGSLGSQIQTSGGHTNLGVLGQPSALSPGRSEASSATHRHIGGFAAGLK